MKNTSTEVRSTEFCITDSVRRERLIPESVLRAITAQLTVDAVALATWKSSKAEILSAVVRMLEEVIDNPVYVWVPLAKAAEHLGKSEETIRRYCRTNSAPFAPFRYRVADNGRYEIWLPDIHAAKEERRAA